MPNRNLTTEFWTNPKVYMLSKTAKYLWIYYITSPMCAITGVVRCRDEDIAYQTSLSLKEIGIARNELIENDMVAYSKETYETLIINFSSYNWTTSSKLIESVKKQIPKIKNEEFRNFVTAIASQNDNIRYGYGMDTVSIWYRYGINTKNDEKSEEISSQESQDNCYNYLEYFEQFWSEYPKKVGKQTCINWFKSHKPNAELVKKMLNSIENQRKTPQWSENKGKYIPNPLTWLHQGRWEDISNVETNSETSMGTAINNGYDYKNYDKDDPDAPI